jgi:hypothetical protein
LSVAPQNLREDEDSAGHASRSRCLLCLEASRARVYQSGLKTDGDAMDGARVIITEVVWRSKLKMGGSMRRVMTDPATHTLMFLL